MFTNKSNFIYFFVVLMIFVENISYANEDITIFPAINEYKESKEKELRADFGKCLGIVDIEGKEYVYYDSRLDKIDEANLNRLRPFELLLYNKAVKYMNDIVEKESYEIKIADEIKDYLWDILDRLDIVKQCMSALGNLSKLKFAELIFQDLMPHILTYFQKKWCCEGEDNECENATEDIACIKGSVAKEVIMPILNEIVMLEINIMFELMGSQMTKLTLKTFVSDLGVVLAVIDGIIKTEKLAVIIAANWKLKEHLEEINFAMFSCDFIREYVFDHRCNIEKMAKKYNVKDENFWSLCLAMWNKKNSFLTSFLTNKNKLSKIARDTLDLIEQYGDGGMYKLIGASEFNKYFSDNTINIKKVYKFKERQNLIYYFLPQKNETVNNITKPQNMYGTGYLFQIAPLINDKEPPLIEIDSNILSYENQIVHFSDDSTESKDLIKISSRIKITYELRDKTKDIQERTISEIYIPAPTHPFPDVSCQEWYAKYIADLYNKRIVVGDQNGNFNPNNNITGGEFLKIFTQIAYSKKKLEGIHNFANTSICFSKYPLFIVNDLCDKFIYHTYFENIDLEMLFFNYLFNIESEDELPAFLSSELSREKVAQFIHYFYSLHYEVTAFNSIDKCNKINNKKDYDVCFDELRKLEFNEIYIIFKLYKLYSEEVDISSINKCGELDNKGWDNCSKKLKELLIIDGNMGYFEPDNLITRAEAIKIIHNFDKFSDIRNKDDVQIPDIFYDPKSGGGQKNLPDNSLYYPNNPLLIVD